MRPFLVCATAVLFTGALGCAREKTAPLGPLPPPGPLLAEGQVLRTSGTVRFVGIEGGCWALETDAGTYQPTSLPSGFQRDGLHVRLVVRGTRLSSFCQIAQVVAVDTIEAR
jgi:hypothetical protein